MGPGVPGLRIDEVDSRRPPAGTGLPTNHHRHCERYSNLGDVLPADVLSPMPPRKKVKRSRPTHRPVPARHRTPHRVPPTQPTTPAGTYRRFEVDLVHEAFRREGSAWLHRLQAVFREREVVEVEGLLQVTASLLQGLSSLGFRRVDHWEVHPGGWLPLPERAHRQLVEPVGHLLAALESSAWRGVREAHSFGVRLSGVSGPRIDLVVRRVHREWTHAVTVEVRGEASPAELGRVERALRSSISVARLRAYDHPARHPFGPGRDRGSR